jgi:formiminotetrahydrofolate cyclodeaminase
MLTDNSIRQFTDHVASQDHAMAGATIAASAAAACSLGEAWR